MADILARLGATTDDAKASELVKLLPRLDLPPAEHAAVLIPLLDHPTAGARTQAMLQLRSLKANGRAAVPRLLELLRETTHPDEVNVAAIKALGACAEGTPEIVQQLESVVRNVRGNAHERLAAIDVLGAWGPAAESAAPMLRELQTDDQIEVQLHAFNALGRISALPSRSLEELRTVDFASLPPPQAYAALRALREAGPDAKFPATALAAWYAREDALPSVKLAILETLHALRCRERWYAAAVFETFQKYSREPTVSTEVVNKMARSIRQLDPMKRKGPEVLVARLLTSAERQRKLAGKRPADSRQRVFDVDEIIAELLRKDDGSTDPFVLAFYLDVARAIGPHAVETRAAVADLLDPTAAIYRGRHELHVRRLRGYLLVTLADVGVPNTALPHILSGLSNPQDQLMCASSARAAGALGPSAADATPALIALLEAPANYHDAANLDRFGVYNPGPAKGTTARLEAIRALAHMGKAAGPALPVLRELGSYHEPDFSQLIAGGYKGIQNSSRFLVPRREAEAARKAIAAIEGPTASAKGASPSVGAQGEDRDSTRQ